MESDKNIQEPRQEDEKTLKREDELTDISKLPESVLTGEGEKRSLLTKLNEGIHNVTSQITDKIHEVKQNVLPAQGEGEKTTISEKISQGIESVKNRFTSEKEGTQEEPTQPEESTEKGPSIKDKVRGGIESISSTISHGIDSVKSTFTSATDKVTLKEGLKNQQERLKEGEFHEVTTGFSETVAEFKEEQRIEELGQLKVASNNPFDALSGEDITLAQPLSNAEIVGAGGDIVNITTAADVSHVTDQEPENQSEDKSLTQKLKDGVSGATTMLGDKFTDAKNMIKSAFVHGDQGSADIKSKPVEGKSAPVDKENAPQTA